MSAPSRRDFLRDAAILAAGSTAAASVACDRLPAGSDRAANDESGDSSGRARATGLTAASLDSLADAVLPESLGANGRRAATVAFAAWMDGYQPVAEEMHGYGYADVRYLPPDPAPAWRAQLDALDLLAQQTRGASFVSLPTAARRDIVTMALRRERGGDRLPAPLGASHVAIALLSHWASGPGAWNLALGVNVSPGACRPLGDAVRKPLPVVPSAVQS